MTLMALTTLAHQGGWDEIAMVAGPLLVFAAVLVLANKRATTKLNAAKTALETETAESDPDIDSDPDSD